MTLISSFTIVFILLGDAAGIAARKLNFLY